MTCKFLVSVHSDSLDLKSAEARERIHAAMSKEFKIYKVKTENYEETLHPKHNGLPDAAICFFHDGTSWCCVFGDFQNLQVSPAGFGTTFANALESLDMAFSDAKRQALNKAINQ